MSMVDDVYVYATIQTLSLTIFLPLVASSDYFTERVGLLLVCYRPTTAYLYHLFFHRTTRLITHNNIPLPTLPANNH